MRNRNNGNRIDADHNLRPTIVGALYAASVSRRMAWRDACEGYGQHSDEARTLERAMVRARAAWRKSLAIALVVLCTAGHAVAHNGHDITTTPAPTPVVTTTPCN